MLTPSVSDVARKALVNEATPRSPEFLWHGLPLEAGGDSILRHVWGSGVRWPKKTSPEQPLKAFSELGRTWDTPRFPRSHSLHPAIDRTGTRRRLAIAMVLLAPQLKQSTIHWPVSGSARRSEWAATIFAVGLSVCSRTGTSRDSRGMETGVTSSGPETL